MKIVKFISAESVVRKLYFVKILCATGKMGLREGKEAADKIFDKKMIEIEFKDEQTAKLVQQEVSGLGVECELI